MPRFAPKLPNATALKARLPTAASLRARASKLSFRRSAVDDAIDVAADCWLLVLLMRPIIMLVLVVAYLKSEPYVARLRIKLKLRKKANKRLFTLAVVAHNVGLAVFSAWMAYRSWPLFLNKWASEGLREVHCSSNFWDDEFGYLAKVFYASKFYEFADSWLLVLKNREPSFLQKYHHAGIVVTMWAGVATQSNWLVWPTVLNSAIHTLMYSYYAAATLGYKSPYAKYLTRAQMTQFVVGILGASSTYLFGCQAAPYSKRALFLMQLYAAGLLVLFGEMARAKYGGKKPRSPRAASPRRAASPARSSPRLAARKRR